MRVAPSTISRCKSLRPDCFAKGFAQAVKKIEDERFLDLNFLFRTLELPNAAPLPRRSEKPAGQSTRRAAREEERPHDEPSQLTSRCLVMEVLL